MYDYIDLEHAKLEDALLALHSVDLRAMTQLLPIAEPLPTRKAEGPDPGPRQTGLDRRR